MATARMDTRGLGRYANSLVSMVRWRQTMGPPFRVPSGIFFRRSAMANSSGSSHHSGADAMVADVAAETAMLLGIPAQVEGNLIRVSTGLVGVNEACSGIRSLQTSLMIGLLFGELKRLSVLRRVALVIGAVGHCALR